MQLSTGNAALLFAALPESVLKERGKRMNQNAENILREVKKAVIGKDKVMAKVLCTMLAQGHVLLEDIPGVGKTTMANAFAGAMSLKEKRMQFTPDVMPADVTGFHLFNKETGTFQYHEGPIMSNLFLADEINRTSPKTQSALLEVMEEGTVTIDGETRKVPAPFFVIATQNPAGSAGTSLLPESQMDRFLVCLSLGYPNAKEEMQIARMRQSKTVNQRINPVATPQDIQKMQREAESVYVHELIYDYAVRLIQQTRKTPLLQMGASPRATIALIRMACAWAYVSDRDYVLPGDIKEVFLDVTAHRVLLSAKARVSHMTARQVLTGILEQTKAPKPGQAQ